MAAQVQWWTLERLIELHRVHAEENRNRVLTAQLLSKRWGRKISPASAGSALRDHPLEDLLEQQAASGGRQSTAVPPPAMQAGGPPEADYRWRQDRPNDRPPRDSHGHEKSPGQERPRDPDAYVKTADPLPASGLGKGSLPPPPPIEVEEDDILGEENGDHSDRGSPHDFGLACPHGDPAEGQTVAPFVRTSKTRGEAYLIISDTQEPYSAPAALPFVLAVAKEFGVPLDAPGSVYHVGDEVDFLNFSRFLRSPEAPHTPNQELQAVRDRLQPWKESLPFVRFCKSNHGDRVLRRAADAGLPSQLLRAHRDILEAPPGWEWANDWRVRASKQPFLVEHGHHGGQSTAASRQRPAWNGISTCWGHMHAQAGVWHVKTHGQQVWGLCVGSLIDRDAVAFEYGKPNTWQPWLGVGVVLDGGRTPILIPYGGNWP